MQRTNKYGDFLSTYECTVYDLSIQHINLYMKIIIPFHCIFPHITNEIYMYLPINLQVTKGE